MKKNPRKAFSTVPGVQYTLAALLYSSRFEPSPITEDPMATSHRQGLSTHPSFLGFPRGPQNHSDHASTDELSTASVDSYPSLVFLKKMVSPFLPFPPSNTVGHCDVQYSSFCTEELMN